ncbi:hypothetical protein CPB86DRAFT_823997 [Serendipita vermifera]|nr:hypothetical protein CPB86DRAFT_823997 [Serendipita vermifera]
MPTSTSPSLKSKSNIQLSSTQTNATSSSQAGHHVQTAGAVGSGQTGLAAYPNPAHRQNTIGAGEDAKWKACGRIVQDCREAAQRKEAEKAAAKKKAEENERAILHRETDMETMRQLEGHVNSGIDEVGSSSSTSEENGKPYIGVTTSSGKIPHRVNRLGHIWRGFQDNGSGRLKTRGTNCGNLFFDRWLNLYGKPWKRERRGFASRYEYRYSLNECGMGLGATKDRGRSPLSRPAAAEFYGYFTNNATLLARIEIPWEIRVKATPISVRLGEKSILL